MAKKRTGLAGKAAFGASALLLAVALPSAGSAFGALSDGAVVRMPTLSFPSRPPMQTLAWQNLSARQQVTRG